MHLFYNKISIIDCSIIAISFFQVGKFRFEVHIL
jgi:hypothetical protein